MSADAKMTVFFMMKHDRRDVKALEQKLLAVSDPRSAEYGQHLSTDELAEMLPISDVALDSVMSLLDAHDVTDFSVNKYRDMVEATVTVGQANAMFGTEVRVFAHASKPVKLLRAVRPYSLPKHVAEHVSFVGDLVRLPVRVCACVFACCVLVRDLLATLTCTGSARAIARKRWWPGQVAKHVRGRGRVRRPGWCSCLFCVACVITSLLTPAPSRCRCSPRS